MATLFALVLYAAVGFLALIGLLVVVTAVFCKRVEKRWEYEADFRNTDGREIGELDIAFRRYPGESRDFSLSATFHLRHESLRVGRLVEVYLDGVLIMNGRVEKAGFFRLSDDALVGTIDDPATGQLCVVKCEGHELVRGELHPD